MTFKNKIDDLFMEMVKSSLTEGSVHLDDHDPSDPDFKKLVKKLRLKTKSHKDGTMVTGKGDDIEKMLKTMYGNDWKDLYTRKGDMFEDASNDQSDDGDGMDKVDPKAVKKKFKDRKDKDIDNDGDVDDSDEYLHKRRKAISKAVDESKVEEGKRGFIMAAKAAKEKGEKTFMFAGKEYNCEDIDEDGNMKEFHAPGMAPKGRAKAKPASTKKSLSDIRKRADNFKKKANESVELEEESKTIAKVKEIVAKKQAMKIDGVMVDMFTASAIAQIYDKVNDANKKKMDGLKITKLADVAMKLMKREEVELEEEEQEFKPHMMYDPKTGKGYKANKPEDHERMSKMGYTHDKPDVQEKKNYEYKDGKVHISKKDFRKVHKDFKNTTKGKERMMILDPKTQASVSVPVVFTESNFRETFRNSVSKRLSESSKNEEKSDEVANRYNELKQLAPVELTKLYMKHHEDADMDSVKKMEKSQMISAIIEKEMGGKDAEPESED